MEDKRCGFYYLTRNVQDQIADQMQMQIPHLNTDVGLHKNITALLKLVDRRRPEKNSYVFFCSEKSYLLMNASRFF